MTPKPDNWNFCDTCGTALIKRHYIIRRRDDVSYAAEACWLKGVPGYCVYEGSHEAEGRAKRRVAR